jgi:hypothetical protein
MPQISGVPSLFISGSSFQSTVNSVSIPFRFRQPLLSSSLFLDYEIWAQSLCPGHHFTEHNTMDLDGSKCRTPLQTSNPANLLTYLRVAINLSYLSKATKILNFKYQQSAICYSSSVSRRNHYFISVSLSVPSSQDLNDHLQYIPGIFPLHAITRNKTGPVPIQWTDVISI